MLGYTVLYHRREFPYLQAVAVTVIDAIRIIDDSIDIVIVTDSLESCHRELGHKAIVGIGDGYW